jgi:hypothetical protein
MKIGGMNEPHKHSESIELNLWTGCTHDFRMSMLVSGRSGCLPNIRAVIPPVATQDHALLQRDLLYTGLAMLAVPG